LDELARYVAGPTAVAGLGVALFNIWEPLGLVVLALAAVWAVAAFITWRRDRGLLKDRVIRFANRLRRCVPNWWEDPDYTRHSTFGTDATVAKAIAELMSHRDKWRAKIWHPRRRYTARLHRRLVDILEEMGAVAGPYSRFERYLSEWPQPSEISDLARDLAYDANQLSSRRTPFDD
jgi:hypothetical protein